MPRASRGAGVSYSERPNGTWVANVSLGYENGKRVRQSVYGKTKADAADKAREVLNKAARGESTTPGKETVAAFFARYLEHVAARRSSATYDDYERTSRKYIVPHLGKIKLAKLAPSEVAALYAKLHRQGIGDRTVLKVHKLLHVAYEYALRLEEPGVNRNPAARVGAPAYEASEMTPFTAEQAARFDKAIQGDRNEGIYMLAIFTGMRQGEIFALQLSDLDLDNGALNVRLSLDSRTAEKLKTKRAKTEASRRRVNLEPFLVKVLRAHRERVIAEKIESTFVFPNEAGEALDRHNFLPRDFYPLLKRAGLPKIRFHDLRHTCASMAFLYGVHPKVVQEMLGHSRISTTLDTYSHLIPTMGRDAAALLGRKLGRTPPDESAEPAEGVNE